MPLLILFFHVNAHYAVGASLICVIVASSTGAAAYIREGYANLRIAMILVAVAVAGGVAGALISGRLAPEMITVTFGAFLVVCGVLSWQHRREIVQTAPSDPLVVHLSMEGSYPSTGGWQPYKVYHVICALGAMVFAGILAGLLGIGAGVVNVLVMDRIMQLPYKVSSTTSNFMTGITAAGGAGIHLKEGFISPSLVMPVMLGVLLGASGGARILPAAKSQSLRVLFSAFVFIMAVEMVYRGSVGRL